MPITRSSAKKLNIELVEDFASPRRKRKAPPASQGMESSGGDGKRMKAEPTKTIALAEDEKKLDGAPETELADVTVFPFAELEVVVGGMAEKEVELSALQLLKKEKENARDSGGFDADWVMKFDAISSIRRLSKFQPRSLVNHISELLPVVCGLCAHLRSALSRNAILCIGEISRCGCKIEGGASPDTDLVETQKKIRLVIESNLAIILSALIYKAASDKKFLAETAKRSLKSLIIGLSGGLLLEELLVFSDPNATRSPAMMGVAAQCTDKCLDQLGIGTIAGKGFDIECPNKKPVEFCKDVINGLNNFSTCRSVDAKKHAKTSLQKMRVSLGGSFPEIVKALLIPSDAERILKDSQSKNARVGGKSSLRDRIAADRAKVKSKKGLAPALSKEPPIDVGIMQFANKAQASNAGAAGPDKGKADNSDGISTSE